MIYRTLVLTGLAIVGIGGFGCQPISERLEPQALDYFDLKGSIVKHISSLSDLNPSIEKRVSINGQEEVIELRLDSLEWIKELDPFMQADINKPVLRGLYLKSTDEEVAKSITYQALEEVDQGTTHLVVSFNSEGALVGAEALYREANMLYYSERKLKLIFGYWNNQLLLKSYTILGKQKMLARDSVHYSVQGSVLF